MRYLVFIFLVIVAGCRKSGFENSDPASFVDPFIGTGGDLRVGFGNTYPGASYPFGMIQLSPDNGGEGWEYSSGYHYPDSVIAGFSHTHLSGTGVGDLCDISLMPTTKETGKDYDHLKYRSRFTHKAENASIGYYFVNLKDDNIDVELTVSEFVGMHRYRFPKGTGKQNLILNLGFNINRDSATAGSINRRGDDLVTGYRFSTGWAKVHRVFFAMQFSRPVKSMQFFNADTAPDKTTASGDHLAEVFTFDSSESEQLLVKVAISSVSEDGAIANLKTADKYGWDFDRLRADTRKTWNDLLSKISVTTSDKTRKTIFYTALYHCYLAPNRFSDVDGFYKNFNHTPEKAEGYTHYTVLSLWDTFRAEKPLLAIMQPALYSNIVNSMLSKYRQTGELPYWELEGNEGGSMIGYHSVPVIADAILKNIGSFDKELAFKAMVDASETNRKGLDFYREFHFVPVDKGKSGTVSKTLEYCFDDWCIARVAKYLGKEAEYKKYMNRSEYYRNLYDPDYKLMRGRNSNGTWYEPFHPRFAGYGNEHTVEGDTWQYSFFVPHDLPGLISLMGGKKDFEMMLDSLFNQTSDLLGEDTEDVTGMVGQYSQGNEPDHHAAYLYDLVGRPGKTQYFTNKIIDSLYSASPDGLCGNEDCGQMSAWYVFSSIGFYPVNPIDSRYYFGSPQFKKVVISLPSGRSFIVEAKNVSEKNIFFTEARLNGKKLDRSYVTYDEILTGGILEFEMAGKPVLSDSENTDIEGYEDKPFVQETHDAFRVSDKNSDNEVRSITVDKQSNIWIATASGIFMKKQNSRSWEPVITGKDRGPAYSVVCNEVGEILLGTWNGIYRYRNNSLTKEEGVKPPVSEICSGRAGDYALGPYGIWRYVPDKWVLQDYQIARSVKDAESSGNGDLWVATDAGLYRCREGNTRLFQDTSELISCYTRAISFSKNGELWAGVLGGVSIRKNDKKIKNLTSSEGIPSAWVNCIARADDGRMWVGTNMGVVRFDENYSHSLRFSRRWLTDNKVNDIAFDSEGNAWIATDNGVSAIMRRKMTLAGKEDYFYDQLMKKHIRNPWICGNLRLEIPGDTSSWKNTDDDNDGEYTGGYLAMESFRYAATGNEDARIKARKAFDFLKLLHDVTGKEGFFARTIVPAGWTRVNDGNRTYTERELADLLVEDPRYKPVETRWHLSKDKKWLWKGDTSSDEMDGHMMGYFFYYEYAAGEEDKALIRYHVKQIVDNLIKNNYNLIDVDGKHTRWAVWSPEQLNGDPDWASEKALNSFELLAYLKFASHITGDQKYEKEYRKLIEKDGYLENASRLNSKNPAWQIYFDLTMEGYLFPILLKYEDDPALKTFYSKLIDEWMNRQKSGENLINNLTYAIATGKKVNVDQTIEFLRDAPLDLVDWRIDHTLREDVKIVRSPILEEIQISELPPASMRATVRWDKNPWSAVSGDPSQVREPNFWLWPYWMARYLGLIRQPVEIDK